MAKNRIAIYPGTFDPITLGHEDVVRRAADLFDEVIVAVADSTNKNTLFSLQERVAMAQGVFSHAANIKVMGFSGLLMQFVQDQGAKMVIRGLRAASDFEYEFQLAGMNRKLYPQFETLFLTPSEQFMFISSSLVREVAVLGGDVQAFLSQTVNDVIKQKLGN
ncbi:CoaD Phosphopantetheine adenylyltransferase [Methylophilaceae bacterium]|jgi:pantetheine-phosphate adenylyltransferase